jgi:uncharacterized protein YjiS (DUF1127 family)
MADGPDIRNRAARVERLWAPLRTPMVRLRSSLTAHYANWVTRRAFMNTFRLDDKMLDDIGVTREEVKWAASLPLRVNASHALYARARKRRDRAIP